jgi:hypothetical protein
MKKSLHRILDDANNTGVNVSVVMMRSYGTCDLNVASVVPGCMNKTFRRVAEATRKKRTYRVL